MLDGLPDRLLDVGAVLGVNVRLERGEGAGEGAGREAVNRLQLGRPRHAAGGHRPVPRAHPAGRDGQPQALLALANGRLCAALVHHAGAHRQHGHRERGHERLQEEKGLVGRADRKRADAADGARDRDGAEHRDRGDRLPLAEADRRPEQRGNAEESDRHVTHADRQDAAEDEEAHPDHRGAQQQRLRPPGAKRGQAGLPVPEKDQRGHDEVTGGVAEPPRQPDGAVVAPARESAQRQAGHADGGADGRAQKAGEADEEEDAPDAIEDVPTAREAIHQLGAEQALERIAQRDRERRRDRARGTDVDEEGAHEDDRPDAQAQNEKGGQRDARRGPDRRGAGVQEGKVQPELAGQEIDEPDGGRERDTSGWDRHRGAPVMGVRYTTLFAG